MLCHSAGCGSIIWNVTDGLPNVRGARYVLNLYVAPGVGMLAPAVQGSSNVTGAAPGAAAAGAAVTLTELEVIVGIQPRKFFSKMNETDDYSYVDAPVINSSAAAAAAGAPSGAGRRRMLMQHKLPLGQEEELQNVLLAQKQQGQHQPHQQPLRLQGQGQQQQLWQQHTQGSLFPRTWRQQQQELLSRAASAGMCMGAHTGRHKSSLGPASSDPVSLGPVARRLLQQAATTGGNSSSAKNSSSSGSGGQGAPVVRRQRVPNPQMPAYLDRVLAWGSPPRAGEQVRQMVVLCVLGCVVCLLVCRHVLLGMSHSLCLLTSTGHRHGAALQLLDST